MKIVRSSILSIVLVNDPGGLREDDGQSSPSKIRYRREPHESIEMFRDRACGQAERAGDRIILFGDHERARGEVRHIPLTEEGEAFSTSLTAGCPARNYIPKH